MKRHDGKYVLVNSTEELVRRHVSEVMAKTDMCRCEKCFLDVCALVYNKGFAHFTTTRKGGLLAKVPDMNRTNHVELMVAVADAVEKVKAHPMHEVD